MNIGIIGLGKLGLPFAVTMASRGFDVIGYDLSDNPRKWIENPDSYPYVESGPGPNKNFNKYLAEHPPSIASHPGEVYSRADIVFIAVETPHDPEYDGTHPVVDDPVDFDYTALRAAVLEGQVYQKPGQPVVVISTCLPGTMTREIQPLMGAGILVYNPFFIAMSTVMHNLLNPEFVLLGFPRERDKKTTDAINLVADFYNQFYVNGRDYLDEVRFKGVDNAFSVPELKMMSWESAELTKVSYNTYISFKIGFANTISGLCDHISGADADDVMETLKAANSRLTSPAYLSPGMGDGGGCHPRDNIAMTWLCDEVKLPWNPFRDVMNWREAHAYYLTDMLQKLSREHDLPIAILGFAFKKNMAMIEGSHALLVNSLLDDALLIDPVIDPQATAGFDRAHVVLIGMDHDKTITDNIIPSGSVVVDPFDCLVEVERFKKYIPLGKNGDHF